MLQRGDDVPHFEVTVVDDGVVRYREIWQRRPLLLVALARPDDPAEAGYAGRIAPLHEQVSARDSTLVVTFDRIAGLPPPAVLIADRWGEIHHIARGSGEPAVGGLPDPDELLEWLDYVRRQCPECQGEAR